MDRTPPQIDEYTLAAFLAGTLPPDRRDEVAAYLAQHAEARELLVMAHAALQAAEVPADVSPATPLTERPAATPTRTAPSRAADRAATPVYRRAVRFTAVLLLMVAVGLGLRLALTPSVDLLRSSPSEPTLDLSVRTTPGDLAFTWQAVPNAYQYRVVVWDPQEARVVARYETKVPHLAEGDSLLAELTPLLETQHPYTLRIDALDAQNRILLRSEAYDFILP